MKEADPVAARPRTAGEVAGLPPQTTFTRPAGELRDGLDSSSCLRNRSTAGTEYRTNVPTT